MSRRGRQFRCIAAIVISGIALAAGPASRPATGGSSVHELIEKLSSERWTEREGAQEELVRKGIEGLTELQQVRRGTVDDDLRTRLDAVLGRIAFNQKFGASLVSMRLKDVRPQEAMVLLSKQSGIEIRLPQGVPPGPVGNITAEFDRRPFWEVMRTLCDSAQMMPMVDGRRQAINLQYGQWKSQRSCIAGPLLVVAGNVTRACTIDLANPQVPERSMGLEVQVIADPKLRVLRFSPTVHLDEATDDAGDALAPEQGGFEGLAINANAGVFQSSVFIQLLDPPRPAKRLVRLRGSMRVILPSNSERIEIGNLRTAGVVTKSVGGRRFTVGEMKKSGEAYVLPLTLYRGALGREEWRQLLQSNGVRQAVRILDGDGNPLAIRVGGSANGDLNKTESTLNLTITRDRIGKAPPEAVEPVKFIYEVTTEVRDMVVPFELSDIALP